MLGADDESGSSPVEFILVGALLTMLTLAVLQLGLVMYVRNVVHDAAVEGAYYAALADTQPAEGVERTRSGITAAVGAAYAADVTASIGSALGHPTSVITVRTTLPLLGLIGIPFALEVNAHAPTEELDG